MKTKKDVCFSAFLHPREMYSLVIGRQVENKHVEKKKISPEEAVEDILIFGYEESGDEDSELDELELYGDDEDIRDEQ